MCEIIMLGGSLVDGTGAVSLRNRELIGNRAAEMFLTGGARACPLSAIELSAEGLKTVLRHN